MQMYVNDIFKRATKYIKKLHGLSLLWLSKFIFSRARKVFIYSYWMANFSIFINLNSTKKKLAWNSRAIATRFIAQNFNISTKAFVLADDKATVFCAFHNPDINYDKLSKKKCASYNENGDTNDLFVVWSFFETHDYFHIHFVLCYPESIIVFLMIDEIFKKTINQLLIQNMIYIVN